jgi:hypothetical protein
VLTPSGYKKISTLQVGDQIMTADGKTAPIVKLSITRTQPTQENAPYIIPKGMFGATRDLAISPRHRVAVPGRGMVEAQHLGLERKEMHDAFNYYNIEVPGWANMTVAGVEVESLAPIVRVAMTVQSFIAALRRKYGNTLTTAQLEDIARTCRFLDNGMVDAPAFRITSPQ